MAKVLIVDDEVELCEEFAKLLAEYQHEVDIAENGMIALDKCAKSSYDIIFLDVLMPRMEGREVLEEIRKTSQVPVAIISAYLSPDKEKEARKLGAVACFRKPFDMKAVKRLIDQVDAKKGSS
jgi:two-component system response regulator VanR